MEFQEYSDITAIHIPFGLHEEQLGDQIIFYPSPTGLLISEDEKGNFLTEEDTFTFVDFSRLELILRPIIQLFDIYVYKNVNDVINYLLQNNQLIEILYQAPNYISKVFGHNIILFLEIDKDPEEDYERLFIIIGNDLSVDNSLDLLEKLEDAWWLNVDSNIKKMLGIDIRGIL